MIAYQQAKLTSKRPQDFGKGSIEGIAANESAQNAANSGELIRPSASESPAAARWCCSSAP